MGGPWGVQISIAAFHEPSLCFLKMTTEFVCSFINWPAGERKVNSSRPVAYPTSPDSATETLSSCQVMLKSGDAIAPFTVVVCPIVMDRSAEVKAAAIKLHDELQAAGVDVMLDDRGERPGAMFADWELIGVPHRVVISDRGLKDGQLEYQHRRDAQATKVATGDVLRFLKGRLA